MIYDLFTAPITAPITILTITMHCIVIACMGLLAWYTRDIKIFK